ncbi:hypothetical protein LSH36_48g06028 [Paralvinella palmiformis]|uniref:Uncharacterized protein n=1 Tax=Paralvinella palmiformis TaxID=53620 RepID=A0AAD9NCU1_9ANNE|nr:hypothetical protein LSH36_48g06028 [Paralvinella palmiformis]
MDRKKKCPSKACFCAVLTTWMVVVGIVLLVCCSLYIKPLIRVMKFRFVTCRVENSFYTTQFICSCGSACRSIYPCALVHVSLNISDGETWTVSLYEDDLQQLSVVSEDRDAMEWCSLKVCHREVLENHRIVGEFFEQYGTRGKTIQCAYDPWNVKAGAVLHVSKLTLDVFHALFWPFLGLLTGVLLCVIFCRRCQNQDPNKGANDVELEASMELTKAEQGKASAQCNATHSMQNADGDAAVRMPNKHIWGRFKKNTSPPSTNHKKIISRGKCKVPDDRKR